MLMHALSLVIIRTTSKVDRYCLNNLGSTYVEFSTRNAIKTVLLVLIETRES